MLHVTDKHPLNFRSDAFTVLVFHTVAFLALIHSCRGLSEVIGPSQPIVAIVGDDVILPCHLDPVMNAFDMTVEWSRPDLDPSIVLVWDSGMELKSIKHPSYKGRTSLFTDELKHGDVSLRLSSVQISDEGRYRCFLPELKGIPSVQLVVGVVSSPVIHMTRNSSGVLLQCQSDGCYPEPELLWLDGEGKLLSAGPTETLRLPDDLYTVFSRLTVEKRLGNKFTCRVQQKNINQARETHVHVPDHFFMVPSTSSTPSPHIITGSVIAALLFVAIILFIVWKWRQKKFKNKRRSPEDGPELTEEEKTITSRGDNAGSQVVIEEGESSPLMTGREEEDNAGNRGEERIPSHSERRDETHHDQLVTKPDMKSRKTEKVPLIPTKGEKHQKQDIIERQVKNDGGRGEGEQIMKQAKEDSGLSLMVVKEGQREQLQNVDQEVRKEEESRQEPVNVEKKEAKEKNKQGRAKKEGSGQTGQKMQQENQREQQQPEAERQSVDNERRIQRTEDKRDETESTPPVTERSDLKIHQETTGRETQEENELQAEKQEEGTSEKKQEETKEQPEKSTVEAKKECEERWRKRVEKDEGADSDENHKRSKEIGHEGRQQTVQQVDVKEAVREQPEESSSRRTGRRVRCNMRKHKEERDLHVDQLQQTMKRKRQEEGGEKTFKKPKEHREEQNEEQMECEDASMEHGDVRGEPQGNSRNSQQDQTVTCQEEQQEEPMEI